MKYQRAGAGIVAIAGLAAGFLLVHESGPRLALADDDKIFAPQFCVPIDTAEGQKIGQADFRVAEVEQTETVDHVPFLCPLLRDRVTGSLLDVWVRLSNENSDENTPPICCVHSVSLGTSLQDFACRTAPNVDERMSLHIPLDDFSEFDHGHYAVTCELGGADRIFSIRIREE